MTGSPLVTVDGLRVDLRTGRPILHAISLSIARGSILGIVGESGSGKTTLALALLGYARRGSRIAQGGVRIGSEELIGRTGRQLRRLRGRLVSYVPQDPRRHSVPGFESATSSKRLCERICASERRRQKSRVCLNVSISRPAVSFSAAFRINSPADNNSEWQSLSLSLVSWQWSSWTSRPPAWTW
jgi:ABC-type glutathione transport system ATPase component